MRSTGEFAAALPLPLRIGIGVHGGQAIVGALQNENFGRHEITVGETVLIASQLEAATRRVLADIVVSAETVEATGRRFRGTTSLKIPVKGRAKPIAAYGFSSAPVFADKSGRGGKEDEADAKAAPAEAAPAAAGEAPAA